MGRLALIEEIEAEHIKKDLPDFDIGDTIRVSVKIIEGGKERIQSLTGTVVARKGSGLSENVTVYRTAYGSAMERVFMIHSPRVTNIEVIRKGKVRRSKLYYICGKMGKKAKIQEKIVAKVSKKKSAKVEAAEPEAKVEEPKAEAKPEAEAEEPKKEEKPEDNAE